MGMFTLQGRHACASLRPHLYSEDVMHPEYVFLFLSFSQDSSNIKLYFLKAVLSPESHTASGKLSVFLVCKSILV